MTGSISCVRLKPQTGGRDSTEKTQNGDKGPGSGPEDGWKTIKGL